MTSCDLPRVQISDPGELIETVPYLLGFHPRESLVLIGFSAAAHCAQPQQVQVSVRVDLPVTLDAEQLQPLVEVLCRAESAAVAAVLVTDAVPGDPRRAAWLLAIRDVLSAEMDAVGIDLLDVLVATRSRWWSLCCDQPECCPAAGHPRALGSSEAAAQATFAGMVALPDRQALQATLAGRGEPERSALLPRLARARDELAGARPERAAAWRQAVIADLLAAAGRLAGDSTAELSEDELISYALALADLQVRDALWLAVDDRSVEASRLMSQLHTRLPAPYDAAPLFVLGWAQWRAGNATLAMMAVERALESEPGYSAAVLLHVAVEQGFDPRSVPLLSQPAAP